MRALRGRAYTVHTADDARDEEDYQEQPLHALAKPLACRLLDDKQAAHVLIPREYCVRRIAARRGKPIALHSEQRTASTRGDVCSRTTTSESPLAQNGQSLIVVLSIATKDNASEPTFDLLGNVGLR